jgi:hypothetical protein
MITRKHLSRRTLLRGLGTALALPVLDSMTPALAAASRLSPKSPNRMVFVYVPNGIIMDGWTPAKTGRDFEFLRIMKPLEPFREKLLVLTGLTHNTGRALGDGPGDHARAAATFLTGVHPKKTAGADISLDISVDQVAAQAVGHQTRFASLELGLEGGKQAGNCDSGYSCAYSNNISWRSPTTPNPPEVNPRLVFERLFGDFDPTESAEARARRRLYNKSILDFVMDDTRRLQKELGASDKRKLDEYLTAVREIEMRIERAEKQGSFEAPDLEKPSGVPVEFSEHARLMFDLLAVALQTDSTRIATIMLAREGSNRAYREIGVAEGHHGLTHHRGNEDWIEKIRQINLYHCQQFAYFLQKLDSIQDGDGTLLDNSMVLYGSGISDGNRHTHHDLPVVIAGKGTGKLRTGRHLLFPKETPMANLYLTMLETMGIRTSQLGDSTGPLQHLADIA